MPISMYQKWRNWYSPPWHLIIHILQVIAFLSFYIYIAQPSVKSIYDYNHMFTSLLFPDRDDTTPYSGLDEIQEFLDGFMDNLDDIYRNSITDFYFENVTRPIIVRTLWKNGTITESHTVSLSIDFFRHIQYFEISTKCLTIAEAVPIFGCTEWTITVRIVQSSGSYCFQTETSFDRNSCSSKYVTDDPKKHTIIHTTTLVTNKHGTEYRRNTAYAENDRKLIEDILQKIQNGTLEEPISKQNLKDEAPVFYRQQLPIYKSLIRLNLTQFSLALIQLILAAVRLYLSFSWHRLRSTHEPAYKELTPADQFHFTVGFWDPFFLLTSAAMVCVSLMASIHCSTLSQFPPPAVIHWYGVGGFLLIVTGLRWFSSIGKCYMVAAIVRVAIKKLINVAFALSPIFLGMMFASVFLFGFVANYAESLISLFECILALTFGDNIYEVYKGYTDGSPIYNAHAFVFVSIMTAVTMWLFFTTFTASMTYIHKTKIIAEFEGK